MNILNKQAIKRITDIKDPVKASKQLAKELKSIYGDSDIVETDQCLSDGHKVNGVCWESGVYEWAIWVSAYLHNKHWYTEPSYSFALNFAH